MSDFVKSPTDTQAQLVAEVAELKAALAGLIAPKQLEPDPVEVMDAWRLAIPSYSHEESQRMIAADAAKRRDEETARYDAARVGCEPGTFRDPFGILRYEQTGTVVPDAQVQADAARAKARFDKAAKEEDLAWRRSAGIEIRHGADDDAADRE